MILVTGGAGFIGSNLHQALYAQGRDVVISDWLGSGAKWRNLRAHPPGEIIPPEALPEFLQTAPGLRAVVHLGAISDTTAADAALVWQSNVAFSQTLWRFCAARGVRFIAASSAATYGDGAAGFDDESSLAALRRLRPLNLYGWSKHAFDLWVAGQVEAGAPAPPAWAGVKFFNVFGPNEYHKGAMASVLSKVFDQAKAGSPVRLFKSHRPGIADGDQRRDFIYVDDVVSVVLWLLNTPRICGIYNVGTGQAGSFREMITAMFGALGRAANIEYIDMPIQIRDSYQYFTQSEMNNLRKAGYNAEFTPLSVGVKRYVVEFLDRGDRYR